MPFWESLKLGQSIFSQLHPSRPTWDASQLPDLDGFNLVVTGGTSGIGLACARALVDKGGRVLILGRDPEKGKKVVEGMVGTGKVEFVEADLGDLESVRKAAEEIKKRVDHIDVLFNNAGIMQSSGDSFSTQGIELHFATNCLAHFLLTNLLLPQLKASPRDTYPRVVNTSSVSHYFPTRKQGLDLESLEKTEASRSSVSPMQRYGQSKLAVTLFSNELQRRHPGVTSTAVNPGTINTPIFRHQTSLKQRAYNMGSWPPETGAINILFAATDLKESLGGKYVGPWAKVMPASNLARDETLAGTLWEWCESRCPEL